MCFYDLTVGVLQNVGAVTMQHPDRASIERSSVRAGIQPAARGLYTHQLHIGLVNVRVEDSHGIGAAAHRRDDVVGLRTCVDRHLFQAFLANDRLEVAHHHGVRVRAGNGTDDVEGRFDVGHPVAHSFIERVLQGTRARVYRHDLRTQQLHAVNVRRLPPYVFRAHVDNAFHAIARRDSRRGHTMLPGACFCNDAGFAQPTREEYLPDAVIDLVRTGMVEVFALKPYLCTAQLFRPALGVVHGTGTTHKVLEFVMEFFQEFRVVTVFFVGLLEFVERMYQRFGHEGPAKTAEMPLGVG